MSLKPAYAIVGFDFDSTLSRLEGIDELGVRSGMGQQMAELTHLAMNGQVALESVYGQRLALIRPDTVAIAWLAERYIAESVPGVEALFKQLLAQNKTVHIISGGIRQAILPMARKLGLPDENVHAVELYFAPDGSYRGFDADSPLARSGGKADVCRTINPNGLDMVMIGDGQTDLESKQAGASFIGFGGVVNRLAVRQGADYFFEGDSLTPLMDLIH